jgi:hypothetical protein
MNTMVFTHIPSSLCLLAAMFAPGVEGALSLLLEHVLLELIRESASPTRG